MKEGEKSVKKYENIPKHMFVFPFLYPFIPLTLHCDICSCYSTYQTDDDIKVMRSLGFGSLDIKKEKNNTMNNARSRYLNSRIETSLRSYFL